MTDTSQLHHCILRRKQVEARTGLSRSTLYARIKAGTFPAPVSLGPRAVGWIASDEQRWVSDRIDAGWSGAATDGKGHRIRCVRRQECLRAVPLRRMISRRARPAVARQMRA